MRDTPLIEKYRSIFEKDKTSLVFAPLAEAYRKIGLIREAMAVVNIGLNVHRNYVIGKVVRANCYYDQKDFKACFEELRPLVSKSRDNIKLMRLYSDVCFQLGRFDDSLESAKYLLFLNPSDREMALRVKDLEKDTPALKEAVPVPSSAPMDDWFEVNLGQSKEKTIEKDQYSEWTVSAPAEERPSTMLVDLFLDQGHEEKAQEILRSISELDIIEPPLPKPEVTGMEEKAQRAFLMDVIDKKLNNRSVLVEHLKATLWQFHHSLVERSKLNKQTG